MAQLLVINIFYVEAPLGAFIFFWYNMRCEYKYSLEIGVELVIVVCPVSHFVNTPQE
ncbi:hypothetical protein GCM10008013_40720 [Paenibacillus segetis]|uniref:Uncharacterized protein n=1 Tax=Paenibacillus segetis TaxID=1325360 RepID=A0ABQ1YRY9_9BACL|nr:hypothetical protein GCM10008013_40720 [Paenibacillus segetis]